MENHDAATRRAHELANELRIPITMIRKHGGIDLCIGAARVPYSVVIYPATRT